MCGLEKLGRDRKTEIGILSELGEEAGAIKANGPNSVACPTVRVPAVGREHPRPTDDISGLHGFDEAATARGDIDLEPHAAGPDEKEGGALLSVSKEERPRREDDIGGASHHESNLFIVEAPQEHVTSQDALQSIHH